MANNYHGIGVDNSFNNIVSGNNITSNIKYGVWFGGQVSNNTFSWNNITYNTIGIWFSDSGKTLFTIITS